MRTTTTTRATEPAATAGDLHVDVWGDGTPVVLVHGSLAVGHEEWEAQRPLAEAGFRLLVLDRRGYGRSPAAPGEDFLADADDVADLLGDGAHLVGHSYGGIGAMLAAARRPEATLSLTLLEPAAALPAAGSDWQGIVDEVAGLWSADLPDDQWVVRFLTAVGSDPTLFPPEFLAAALPLVPVFRQGRAFFDAEPPVEALAAASFPKLVVSGGHHPGFDSLCAQLAGRIGGRHAFVAGAGHEIQFAPGINDALVTLWSGDDRR